MGADKFIKDHPELFSRRARVALRWECYKVIGKAIKDGTVNLCRKTKKAVSGMKDKKNNTQET